MVKFYSVEAGKTVNVPPSEIKYQYTKAKNPRQRRLQLVATVDGRKVYKFAKDTKEVRDKYKPMRSRRKSRKSVSRRRSRKSTASRKRSRKSQKKSRRSRR